MLAVEPHFKVREMACVVKENAVVAPRRSANIGMAVEHHEAITILERATRTRERTGARNVEGSLRAFLA